MRKKFVVGVLWLIGIGCLGGTNAGAAEPWSVLKTNQMEQAKRAGGRALVDSQAQAAIEIVRRADEMVLKDRSEATLRAMLAIYAQAGQMFEKAANDYMALVPSGQATRPDVDGALAGMRRCVNSIKEIKLRYSKNR